MANLSEAYGTITFTGKWGKTMLDLLGKLARLWAECFEYPTYITPCGGKGGFTHGSIKEPAHFTGTGRWAYCYNIECMHQWTLNAISRQADNCGAGSEESGIISLAGYKRLLNLMKIHGCAIIFSFKDHEPGCTVLYEAEYELRPASREGSDGVCLCHKQLSFADYEYTKNSLEKLGFITCPSDCGRCEEHSCPEHSSNREDDNQ